MSSTRTTDSDMLNQERWCSASEYTDGTINALMAAKRIALVEDKNLRELHWFIQWRSLRPGGIDALARKLVEDFPDRIGTPLLRKWKGEADRPLSERDVESIRLESALTGLPERFRFLVRSFSSPDDSLFTPEVTTTHQFVNVLADSLNGLSRDLVCLCVEPSSIQTLPSPWYFQDIFGAIAMVRAKEIEDATNRLADTSITRQMREVLDFCYRRRRMVFIGC